MRHLTATYNGPATVIRLSGRPLAVARSVWLVVCVAAALTFLVALPFRWALLTNPSPITQANLTMLGLTPTFFAAYSLFWEIVIVVPFALVGFIIFWRCGNERITLLTSLFLVVFGVGSGTITPTIRALLGLHPALDLLQHTFEFVAWSTIAPFFYLFPNGRFVPRWTRWPTAIWFVICVFWNFFPTTPLAAPNWPPMLFGSVIGFFWASWLASQVYRYRRVSTPVERQQTKWVLYAMGLIVITMAAVSIVGVLFVPGYDLLSEFQPTPNSFAYALGSWLMSPVIILLPIAIAFSILRYRLWDIDLVINRTLVYGLLTAGTMGLYIFAVGLLGSVVGGRGQAGIAFLVTGLIALIFQPMREYVQRAVNRAMYGKRDEPYAVLSNLRRRLDLALAPDAVLPAIVETVTQTLKLPYAAIRLNNDTLTAAGALPHHAQAESFPLVYQGETIGQLEVVPRAAGESLTPNERHLLGDIAYQAGLAAYNIRLTADLQRARERLVTTREEERRRLRRDLHDGLGPKLAGQTLILEAIRDSLKSDSQNYALVEHLIQDSQTIVTEIRRLTHGLRPPALDDFGLIGAVNALASQCESGKLRINVTAIESMPPLPAAVEVAAYRIVQEALTNVVKHARATTCTVSLRIQGDLKLEIVDDGCGIPLNYRPGVGLISMRERAEEIGGGCVFEKSAAGGTRIAANLPISNYR